MRADVGWALPTLETMTSNAREIVKIAVAVIFILCACGTVRGEDYPQLVRDLTGVDPRAEEAALAKVTALDDAERDALAPLLLKAFCTEDARYAPGIRAALLHLGKRSPRLLSRDLIRLKEDCLQSLLRLIAELGPAAAPACDDIAELLGTDDVFAWKVAAACLSKIGDAALPSIRRAFLDLSTGANAESIAIALGEFDRLDNESLDILLQLLEHPHGTVRRQALKALARQRELSHAVLRILGETMLGQSGREMVDELATALARRGEPGCAVLRSALSEAAADVRAKAVPAWTDCLHQEFREMTALLQHPDERIRVQAIGGLHGANLTSNGIVRLLVEQLTQDSARVRAAVAFTLGPMGHDSIRARRALLRTLQDPEPYVRLHTASALMHVGPLSESETRALLPHLGDEHPLVRAAVADLMAQHQGHHEIIVPALARRFATEATGPKLNDAQLLAKASDLVAGRWRDPPNNDFPSRSPIARCLPIAGSPARYALRRLGSASVPALIHLLQTSDQPDVRRAAADLIIEIGSPALPILRAHHQECAEPHRRELKRMITVIEKQPE
jgi:HEAT repeat protein